MTNPNMPEYDPLGEVKIPKLERIPVNFQVKFLDSMEEYKEF